MAKLSKEQISAIIESKNYHIVDISNYQNLKSEIIVECPKGHQIATNLETFRNDKFYCPKCEGINPGEHFDNPKFPPEKKGFRIVAFDQATEKMGVSIYDAGKLVYYDLMVFTGDTIGRIAKIHYFLDQVVIPNWKPDFLVFEDIQQQHGNVKTYKILAGLLTLCEVTAREHGIEYDTYLPTVWRSGLHIAGKTRSEEKNIAQKLAKEWYDVNVNDDTAEAILIGKYACMQHHSKRAF